MTSAIDHASANFLATLASAGARSLALGIFTATGLAAFRVKSVRVKLFVWKGVLLAALVMPALVLFSPRVQLAVPVPALPEHNTAAAAPTRPVEIEGASAVLVPEITPRESARPLRRVRKSEQVRPVAPFVQSSQPLPQASVPARRGIPWRMIGAGAYLAVALALLSRVLVGVYFSNRLVRSAMPIEDAAALLALWEASSAAGLLELPQLAESDSISVPVMVGVRKPAILLPSGWQKWEADELEAVLAHEVSHIARHDALAQRMALIHRAIFWFSPLGWWLERHLADLAEQASDECALAGGMDRTRYAEALLGFFAELEAGPERVWWQGVSMAKTGQAEKRVDRILAWRGVMSNKLTKSLAVLLVVIAAPAVALMAAVHPAFCNVQAAQAPAAPSAPAAPNLNSDSAQASAPSAAPAPPAEAEDSGPQMPGVHLLPPLHVDVPPVNINVPPVHVDIPAVHVDVSPVHVQVPQIHIDTQMLPALALSMQDGAVAPPMTFSTSGDWNFYRDYPGGYFVGRYEDWGPRFAIVSKDSDELTMAGDRYDAEHARALKAKIPGDFIWFARDEKSYVIRDQAIVGRARQLWQPAEDLSKQQKDLGKQMEDLSKQAEDARQKMEDMKIKLPDLTTEMQKLEESMKQLSANGGTMNDIGDLQRQIGDLQRRIGEAEANAGREQGAWGREQGEWGRKMGEIGRKQGELARKQMELSRDAAHQMREMLDDAVSKGLAKPE